MLAVGKTRQRHQREQGVSDFDTTLYQSTNIMTMNINIILSKLRPPEQSNRNSNRAMGFSIYSLFYIET